MTPLAHAIALEMTKPVKDRRISDPDGIAHRITDFVCFDCSDVMPVVAELAGTTGPSDRLAFLPADQTWIEFASSEGRHAYTLVAAERCTAELYLALRQVAGSLSIRRVATVPIHGDGPIGSRDVVIAPDQQKRDASRYREVAAGIVMRTYAMLSVINSPRIIGRRQHMPHAGLQRKIAASKGLSGKFPLRAWTEIVLQVTPPVTEDGVHEARLSGPRALHYVRQHIRVVGGYLVRIGGKPVRVGGREILVAGHMRGDGSLGLKRTRYRLTP